MNDKLKMTLLFIRYHLSNRKMRREILAWTTYLAVMLVIFTVSIYIISLIAVIAMSLYTSLLWQFACYAIMFLVSYKFGFSFGTRLLHGMDALDEQLRNHAKNNMGDVYARSKRDKIRSKMSGIKLDITERKNIRKTKKFKKEKENSPLITV